jgi:hypothetical protein
MNDDKIVTIDTNLFNLIYYAAENSGNKITDFGNYKNASFGLSPWNNILFDINITSEKTIDEIKKRMLNKEVSNKIMIGPTTKPPDSGQLLLKKGFTVIMENAGMILEYKDMKDIQINPELEIRIIDNENDLLDWAKVITLNLFRIKEERAVYFFDVIKNIYKDKNIKCFLGFYNKKPVCTSMVFLDSENIGGLYFIAAEENERIRQGRYL